MLFAGVYIAGSAKCAALGNYTTNIASFYKISQSFCNFFGDTNKVF